MNRPAPPGPPSRSRDLTTGSIPGHLRALAVPAAVGMVFSTLYNVVDVFFAGLVSSEAQAGLAISFMVFFLVLSVGIGTASAMGALVGGAIGAKDQAGARRLAVQGLSFGTLAAATLFVLGQAAAPSLLAVVSEPGGYRDAAVQYMRVLLFASPGFILGFAANGVLQAQGDTVSMQRAMIAAFFANVMLNPLLVFGIPGLIGGIGFNGIAVSTVLSQTGVMAYVVWRVIATGVAKAPSLKELRPSRACFSRILGQMFPASFAMVVMISAGFIVQYNLKFFGGAAVAAYGVALRIEQLVLLPALGLTSALLPVTAQNLGAGQGERVREALHACWKYGLMFMALACPLLLAFAPQLMSLFSADAEVVRIGTSYLRVDGVILPAYLMLFALNSLLAGLKKPLWTVWLGIYRQLIGVAMFTWLYVAVLDLGIPGVWYGVATSVVTGLALSLIVAHRVSLPLIGGILLRPRLA